MDHPVVAALIESCVLYRELAAIPLGAELTELDDLQRSALIKARAELKANLERYTNAPSIAL